MFRRFSKRATVWFLVILGAFGALAIALYFCSWDGATTVATMFVGLLAAAVVYWQGHLIKQQLAFSTYLDLDKQWNSAEMIAARETVYDPLNDTWDESRLDWLLEFFEKLASLFKVTGELDFIYHSTLGWYAVQCFLYAESRGQIKRARQDWGDDVYKDLEHFSVFYADRDAKEKKKTQEEWKAERFEKEKRFWEQERKPFQRRHLNMS